MKRSFNYPDADSVLVVPTKRLSLIDFSVNNTLSKALFVAHLLNSGVKRNLDYPVHWGELNPREAK